MSEIVDLIELFVDSTIDFVVSATFFDSRFNFSRVLLSFSDKLLDVSSAMNTLVFYYLLIICPHQ